MKYSEILANNNELSKSLKTQDPYHIAVLSNIIVTQFKEIFEYNLRKTGINAQAEIGDYDNILQDSEKFKNHNLVILFWELSNLIDGLQYKSEILDNDKIDELINKTKSEIDFVFNNLNETSAVIMNKFSAMAFNSNVLKGNNLDKICYELNLHLETQKRQNIILVDIEKVLANLSVSNSIDYRYFYSSKALFTIDFLKVYSEFILPIPLSLNGKSKKALIFDCDNTLWKGILGEDGPTNIGVSSSQKGSTPFEEIQTLAKAKSNEGIIIGLCSKNNLEDVNEVLESHQGMILKNQDITIKMVNWKDKVSNLTELAKKLNIGIDSLVFIDDSDFEINFVRENLAGITCMQVPTKLSEYPIKFRKYLNYFFNVSSTQEDLKRVSLYKTQEQREAGKSSFSNLENYLKSLKMEIDLLIDEPSSVSRMSQMTQKTNQFNLTTKRYTENEITQFINSDKKLIIAIAVKDKYGESGITGLSIVNIDKEIANLDTFLMSCRIIGRNIEYAFFNQLISLLKRRAIKTIRAKYTKTLKNEQVRNFYEKLGFTVISDDNETKKYSMNCDQYNYQNVNYIRINNGK